MSAPALNGYELETKTHSIIISVAPPAQSTHQQDHQILYWVESFLLLHLYKTCLLAASAFLFSTIQPVTLPENHDFNQDLSEVKITSLHYYLLINNACSLCQTQKALEDNKSSLVTGLICPLYLAGVIVFFVERMDLMISPSRTVIPCLWSWPS